ncbi:transcription termination factor 2-like isoform X2 [Pollicipes pollicipes]|nr:transcription termination factor 2-like isoform X2 [Pollicipes pollicipes]
MSAEDDSLSSSVDVIPASPEPERPAAGVSRLLAWRSPAPPPGRSTSPLLISSDESEESYGSEKLHGSEKSEGSDEVERSDEPEKSDEVEESDESAVLEKSGKSDDLDKSDKLDKWDDSEESDATTPESPARRSLSPDIIEESFEETEHPALNELWRAAPPHRRDVSSEFSVPDSGRPSSNDVTPPSLVSEGATRRITGDSSGCASTKQSPQGWAGTRNVGRGGSSRRNVADGEDARGRAQRLYSQYVVKKRACPPPEQTSGESGGAQADGAPGAGTGRASDESRTSWGHDGRDRLTASTSPDPSCLDVLSLAELEQQLRQKEMVRRVSNTSALPDGGRRLQAQIRQLREALVRRRASAPASALTSAPASAPNNAPTVSARHDPNQVQQLLAQIQRKRMQYSTTSSRSEPGRLAQLQRDIIRLEAEMMRLQMRTAAASNVSVGKNPFKPFSVTGRPAPLNKPRDAARQAAAASRQTTSLEASLRRGEPTTAVVTDRQRRLEAEARESLLDFGNIRPELAAALMASNPELGRLYGGRMTEARHREACNVTTEVLERLHRSLESRPPPTSTEPAPACLNVPLMEHQQYALSWLRWRESQLPCGGILADDMGLGKTLTMISHCLRVQELEKAAAAAAAEAKNEKAANIEKDEKERDDFAGESKRASQKGDAVWLSKAKQQEADAGAVPSNATLVVCPASVLLQWEAEVKRRTSGRVAVIVYHGPNRKTDLQRLKKADFVLTTYDLVRQEVGKDNLVGAKKAPRSPLVAITWTRVILDEAHQIRNRNTKAAKAMCELQAPRRWLLSGTPIQNSREDLYSLMRFLRAAPFHEYEVWKRWIDNSPKGDERLSLIVKAMVLRRTKDEVSSVTGEPLVALPNKQKLRHTVELDEREREVYDKVFAFCRSSLQEFIKLQEQREYEKELRTNPYARPLSPQVVTTHLSTTAADVAEPSGLGHKGTIKQHHLLVQLLRLRQICCHPGLAKTVMTSADREAAGADPNAEADELGAQLLGLTLDESANQQPVADQQRPSVLAADNPVFSQDWCSSKMVRLLKEINKIMRSGADKLVVVSQWTSMLDIVRAHLGRARVPSCTISGSVRMADRQAVIEAFNR